MVDLHILTESLNLECLGVVLNYVDFCIPHAYSRNKDILANLKLNCESFLMFGTVRIALTLDCWLQLTLVY